MTGAKFAIKSYEKEKLQEPQRKQSLDRELHILKMLDHPHIITLHKTLETHD